MVGITKQDAIDFIMKVTGGVRHVPVSPRQMEDLLLTYGTYHKMCDSDSLHWWEEMWLINGDVIAIGGAVGEPATVADRVEEIL